MSTLKQLIIFSIACNSALIHCMELTTETKNEFVSRTRSLPCSKQYTHKLSNYFIEPRGASIGYYAMCPNEQFPVALRPAEENKRQPSQLIVLTQEGDVYARQFLNCKLYKNITAIALASKRDIFSTIYEGAWYQPALLKIRELSTKKTIKKYEISTDFQVASTFNANPAIAFNKQGTKVIVWGVNVPKRGSYLGTAHGVPAIDYMIFDVEDK